MIPLRRTCPEHTSLSVQCNELNPCNELNKIMRDGPWIKDKWIELRSYMSLVLSDFYRSGKNTGNYFIYSISSFIENIGC
jgi:hypothetical protein